MRAFEEFDVRLALQRFERMERQSLLMHERLRGHQGGGFRKLISCVIGLAGACSRCSKWRVLPGQWRRSGGEFVAKWRHGAERCGPACGLGE